MSEHVKDRYLEWRDAAPDRRAAIDRHLRECDDCRWYYGKMDRLLDPALLGGASALAPDPFLPGRISALSSMRKKMESAGRPGGWMLVLQGAVFAAAVVIGIFIGSIAYDEPLAGDVDEIVSLCREAVQHDDDAFSFEAILADSEGGIQ